MIPKNKLPLSLHWSLRLSVVAAILTSVAVLGCNREDDGPGPLPNGAESKIPALQASPNEIKANLTFFELTSQLKGQLGQVVTKPGSRLPIHLGDMGCASGTEQLQPSNHEMKTTSFIDPSWDDVVNAANLFPAQISHAPPDVAPVLLYNFAKESAVDPTKKNTITYSEISSLQPGALTLVQDKGSSINNCHGDWISQLKLGASLAFTLQLVFANSADREDFNSTFANQMGTRTPFSPKANLNPVGQDKIQNYLRDHKVDVRILVAQLGGDTRTTREIITKSKCGSNNLSECRNLNSAVMQSFENSQLNASAGEGSRAFVTIDYVLNSDSQL